MCDGYAVENGTVTPDKALFAYLYLSVEDGSGREVRVRMDDGVVFDDGPGVDNAVFAYFSPGIDYGPVQDDGTLPDLGVPRNDGVGGDEGGELASHDFYLVEYGNAPGGRLDLSQRNQKFVVGLYPLGKLVVRPHDGVT